MGKCFINEDCFKCNRNEGKVVCGLFICFEHLSVIKNILTIGITKDNVGVVLRYLDFSKKKNNKYLDRMRGLGTPFVQTLPLRSERTNKLDFVHWLRQYCQEIQAGVVPDWDNPCVLCGQAPTVISIDGIHVCSKHMYEISHIIKSSFVTDVGYYHEIPLYKLLVIINDKTYLGYCQRRKIDPYSRFGKFIQTVNIHRKMRLLLLICQRLSLPICKDIAKKIFYICLSDCLIMGRASYVVEKGVVTLLSNTLK